MKKFVLSLIGICLLVFVGLLGFALWPTKTPVLTADNDALHQPDIIAKGRYLAVIGDCAACHSQKGEEAFSGGAAIQSPIGAMYAPNITPDETNGIGAYTLDEFARALRNGIRKDGVTLYPSMPYPSFSRLSDDDIKALFAYFRYDVSASDRPRMKDGIAWPMSIRWPVAIWRKLYAPQAIAFDASDYADSNIARGAYIVQGLGHCGTCHTPRALTLQEKGLSEKTATYLTGNTLIDGWVTTNLHNDSNGLKNWTEQDIVATLSTGRNPHGVAIGKPMNDMITRSGRNWSQEDLNAVAVYLKSLPPSTKTQSGFSINNSATTTQTNSDIAYLYQKNCSSCHGRNGEGMGGIFPPLAGNPTVIAPDAQSVVRLALNGYSAPENYGKLVPLSMPSFASRLSDEDITNIVNYIRNHWGNHAPQVENATVTKLRKVYPVSH